MRYLISFNKLYFLLRDHAKISYLIIIDTRVMVLIKRVMFPLSVFTHGEDLFKYFIIVLHIRQ